MTTNSNRSPDGVEELHALLSEVLEKAQQALDAWDIDDAWRQWEDVRDRAREALARIGRS